VLVNLSNITVQLVRDYLLRSRALLKNCLASGEKISLNATFNDIWAVIEVSFTSLDCMSCPNLCEYGIGTWGKHCMYVEMLSGAYVVKILVYLHGSYVSFLL